VDEDSEEHGHEDDQDVGGAHGFIVSRGLPYQPFFRPSALRAFRYFWRQSIIVSTL
jgi:hypothetical protein